MQKPRPTSRGALVLAAFVILVIAVGGFVVSTFSAEKEATMGKLGRVDFPTSARSGEAQAHFLRGVAALHRKSCGGNHAVSTAVEEAALLLLALGWGLRDR